MFVAGVIFMPFFGMAVSVILSTVVVIVFGRGVIFRLCCRLVATYVDRAYSGQ
jgi:hypothetical protein